MSLLLIIPVFLLFYGGGFVLPFTYSRFRKQLTVKRCLSNGFFGLIVFFFIVTTIADLGVALPQVQSWLYMSGMIGFVALPYVLSGWILVLHYRKKKDGTGSSV
jgi:hypothetical protein